MVSETASRLVSAATLSECLDLSPVTILGMARRGEIPCVKLNPRVIRFDPDAVLARLRERA